MNWNFGFFDADTIRRALAAAGLGAGASAFLPDEAEGAVRSDIKQVVSNAITGKSYKGQAAGTLESPVAQQALGDSFKYKGSSGYFTTHGLTWRHENDHWTPEQIAEGYKGIYNSPDTVVIPNVLGRDPSAQEALWNPNGLNGHSWYMPIVPYKKGFKGVTLYDPETSRVTNELTERGYWGGGSTSSIFTPSLSEGLVQPVGSGTLSAVNSGSFNNSLQEQLAKLKLHAVPLAAGLGAGLALTPDQAFGWGKDALRTADLTPEDSAPLRTGELLPSDIGGSMTADLRLPGTPSASGSESPFWGEMARQFGLGTRGVLGGLGSGLTLGLGDPGRGLSDLMGLPLPQNETEQGRVGLNRGLSDVAGSFLLGAGLAKAPGAAVSTVGRGLSSDPVADAMLTLGDANFAKMLEYGYHIMDLLEQYEDVLGGEDSF